MKEIDELIEKYAVYPGHLYSGDGMVSTLKQLKASLKPVVPNEVAEWYESCECDLEDKIIDAQFEVRGWYYDLGARKAQETIAKMDLYGYTVAKEKLHVMPVPFVKTQLHYYVKEDGEISFKQGNAQKFTEDEINKHFASIKQFAVEVEEEE